MPTRLFSVTNAAEAQPLTANPFRVTVVMQNVGSNNIWISDSKGRAIAQQGLKLAPMGSLTLRYLASENPERDWFAWAETADTNLAIFEVEGTVLEPSPGPHTGGGSGPGGGSNNAAALLLAFYMGGALK